MDQGQVLSIRFGLGALKAVGFNSMENVTNERKRGGKFADVYDFAERIDPKSVNKKSIEALAKAGAFDSTQKNRKQIAESFDILSSYSSQKSDEASSSQMSLFGDLPEANVKPQLKKTDDWTKEERLQKEFEAFGFFLNEHPLDDHISELRKRGVIFSDKFERDELDDGDLIITSGVIAASKHRSSARGRFAYLTISDPFGIFEAMIFDEALITSSRDLLVDGSVIVAECLIRKDEGGSRISVRNVLSLQNFLKNTKAKSEDFEDIKKQQSRSRPKSQGSNNGSKNYSNNYEPVKIPTEKTEISVKAEIPVKKAIPQIEIIIKSKQAVLAIKSLLSQRLAFNENENSTKVILAVMLEGKISKIELPKKYLLDENDAKKIGMIEGVVEVLRPQ